VVRALSPPTRLPLVVAAEVHRPMGGGWSLTLLGGRLPVLLDDRRLVLRDVSLRDILTEPCVNFFPVTLTGQMTDYVRWEGVAQGWGGGFRRGKL